MISSDLNEQVESCVLCGLPAEASSSTPTPTRVRACTCGYSHVECVLRYVARRERKQPSRPAACHQCDTPYRVTPAKGVVLRLLEKANYVWFQRECEMFTSLCLLALLDAGLCMGGMYAIGDALGEDESLQLLGEMSPLLAASSCRLAALAAIAVNAFRCWENALLATLHRWSRVPYVGRLLPQGGSGEEGVTSFARDRPSSPICVVIEGMMFPKIARLFGYLFFDGQSNLNRFVMGGLTFMALRGLAGMYYKHALFSRQLNLIVRNYHEE